MFLYSTLSFLSIFRGTHPFFSGSELDSEPSLSTEAGLGPNEAKSAKYTGYTWKTPGILPVSSVSPQILPQSPVPRPALRLRETRELQARMEHQTQTPSSFPGNFRKREVLGPLSFLFPVYVALTYIPGGGLLFLVSGNMDKGQSQLVCRLLR